ncbi:MAG: hypothetical protein ACLSUQ_06625 [Monoglobus pectinilyticus]
MIVRFNTSEKVNGTAQRQWPADISKPLCWVEEKRNLNATRLNDLNYRKIDVVCFVSGTTQAVTYKHPKKYEQPRRRLISIEYGSH